MPALTDTGAARSLVSKLVWERYCVETRRPVCVTTTADLRSVTGTSIPLADIGCILLVGKEVRVYITHIIDGIILGDDALRYLGASIDLADDCVHISGRTFNNIGVTTGLQCATVEQTADYWMSEFPTVFGCQGAIGCNPNVKLQLRLTDDRPIRQRPYRAPLSKRQEIERQVRELLEAGVIRLSTSPWASPVVLQAKKDGSTRMCVDYRKVNSVTVHDAHPLPRISDILDGLAGCSYYSLINLKAGYPSDTCGARLHTENRLLHSSRSIRVYSYAIRAENGASGVSTLYERFLVYWGLTPQQQPGSYQGGEMMMMKSVFWWRKPEYPEETTDLRQVTDETFHT